LKSHVNRACDGDDAWVTNQPGQMMAIYDLPGIINTSLHLAATPANIKAGFKVAEIYPYNRYVFPEEEILPPCHGQSDCTQKHWSINWKGSIT
jgi:hypothetical protein